MWKTLIFALGLLNLAYADEICSIKAGLLSCGNGTLNAFPQGNYAYILLEHMNITAPVRLSAASFTLKNSQMNALNLQANIIEIVNSYIDNNFNLQADSINLYQAGINGPVWLQAGSVSAIKSFFKQPMIIVSSDVEVDNSSTQGIDIIAHSGSKKPCIKLSGNTVVNGNIRFDDQEGIVYINKLSKIQGKVIGGELIQSK